MMLLRRHLCAPSWQQQDPYGMNVYLLVINATVCMQAVCIICIRFVASYAELCHWQIHRAANRWFKACHVQHSFNVMPTAYRTHSLFLVCLQDNLLGSIWMLPATSASALKRMQFHSLTGSHSDYRPAAVVNLLAEGMSTFLSLPPCTFHQSASDSASAAEGASAWRKVSSGHCPLQCQTLNFALPAIPLMHNKGWQTGWHCSAELEIEHASSGCSRRAVFMCVTSLKMCCTAASTSYLLLHKHSQRNSKILPGLSQKHLSHGNLV